MKKITKLILLIFMVVSCQKTKVDENKKNDEVDFSTIELRVDRGAFHYDSFVLKDTTIIFYPEKEIDSVKTPEHQKYYKTASTSISKSERDQFIQQLLDANIWNLKEKYTPMGECTTNLIITITLNGKTKKIVCDDFNRGCPESIMSIEKEIVRLHGKGLKRIFLPG